MRTKTDTSLTGIILFIALGVMFCAVQSCRSERSGEDRPISLGIAVDDHLPAWFPDGTRIAFQSDRDFNSDIYTMNADGSNQMRLTDTPARERYPRWSPDGKKILFDSNRDGNREIYVMTEARSVLKQLRERIKRTKVGTYIL